MIKVDFCLEIHNYMGVTVKRWFLPCEMPAAPTLEITYNFDVDWGNRTARRICYDIHSETYLVEFLDHLPNGQDATPEWITENVEPAWGNPS